MIAEGEREIPVVRPSPRLAALWREAGYQRWKVFARCSLSTRARICNTRCARDYGTAMRAYLRLDASAVMLNDHTAFRVDWMPFAGLRESGLCVGGGNDRTAPYNNSADGSRSGTQESGFEAVNRDSSVAESARSLGSLWSPRFP